MLLQMKTETVRAATIWSEEDGRFNASALCKVLYNMPYKHICLLPRLLLMDKGDKEADLPRGTTTNNTYATNIKGFLFTVEKKEMILPFSFR